MAYILINGLYAQEISELVSSCLSSPLRREKLATAIENDNYIKKLLNIFTVCEVCSGFFFFLKAKTSACPSKGIY